LFVIGVLAAAFLLMPTGLRPQEGDGSDSFLGSFAETVQAPGQTGQIETFRALLTISPGGGAIETNTAQTVPVTVHGSWQAAKDEDKGDGRTFALTFITFNATGAPGTGFTRETIQLDKSGNSFTAQFLVEELAPDGSVAATVPGCATGMRIGVVPLNNSVLSSASLFPGTCEN
jgi:hypothetical protein